eukprot:TRINITY_DN738_c0_g1_i5.p2 TRINITY_DN738_c0_g1~~TRINITY_DN738_c0_g1_i5.p2  ORF type:complete len:123 (+),score=5.93 TRINITY_DN738_c0_g1_i5:166-534(+)
MLTKCQLEIKQSSQTHHKDTRINKRHLCIKIMLKQNEATKIPHFRNNQNTADVRFRLKPLYIENCQFRIRPYSGCSIVKTNDIDQLAKSPIVNSKAIMKLSLIHICRCRRIERCRSRWSPYH